MVGRLILLTEWCLFIVIGKQVDTPGRLKYDCVQSLVYGLVIQNMHLPEYTLKLIKVTSFCIFKFKYSRKKVENGCNLHKELKQCEEFK